MENLNAEQIKKALECCTTNQALADCKHCPYEEKNRNCLVHLMADVYAIITSQEQGIKKLTEDLHATRTELTQNLHECKADTVRKMQEMLKTKIDIDLCSAVDCAEYVTDDLPKVIDQIAKEMLEGDNDNT